MDPPVSHENAATDAGLDWARLGLVHGPTGWTRQTDRRWLLRGPTALRPISPLSVHPFVGPKFPFRVIQRTLFRAFQRSTNKAGLPRRQSSQTFWRRYWVLLLANVERAVWLLTPEKRGDADPPFWGPHLSRPGSRLQMPVGPTTITMFLAKCFIDKLSPFPQF